MSGPGFADGRDQSGWINAEEMRLDSEIRAVGIERAKDHKVGVEILGDAQHGGARKLGRRWEAVALEFAGAAGVGVDLFAGIGQILDGEFFEAFAEPVEARAMSRYFRRERPDINPVGRKTERVAFCAQTLDGRSAVGASKRDEQSAGDAVAH